MKIVIELSEEIYKEAQEQDVPFEHLTPLCKAIENGTPLPKGHGRLIDANVLVDGFEDNYEFCEAINSTPTIIEADKERYMTRIEKEMIFIDVVLGAIKNLNVPMLMNDGEKDVVRKALIDYKHNLENQLCGK